jgi:pimeloyl-ACP methyl ester carboxylesterase
MGMANFVLVHGAWHGGWCYRDTAKALRAAGHNVFTPTHTGVGERSHQSSEAITLETHIRDVCGTIQFEELNDVILCGHSYGGMVITGVADRMAERIKALVYLDAFVPQHGDSLNALIVKSLPAEVWPMFVNGFRDAARTDHCGLMQAIPAAVFNIREDNRAWVDRLCRPQALATFECPVLLTGDIAKVKRRHYILADGWDPSPFRYFATQCEKDSAWSVAKLPCSHDVMVDMPKELAAELLKLA